MSRPSFRAWQRRFFRGDVFTPADAAAAAQAPAEARFVFKTLGLRRGSRLLDVCCGTGRHDFPLARRGVRVVGVDVTEEYLARARRRAGRRANPSFLRADMRRLDFCGEFDAAINLWTSFGYFASAREDRRALRSIRAALKPGGLFLVDVVNGARLGRRCSQREWHPGPGGSVVLEESRLREGRDPRVESVWTVIRPGRAWKRVAMMVRVYDLARLSRALRAAGFRVERAWGGLAGEKLDEDSPRLVVLARRD